jgi:hypothetical protein
MHGKRGLDCDTENEQGFFIVLAIEYIILCISK